MTNAERNEIEALAAAVCPHTYCGLPCDRPVHDGRHWASGPHGQGVNWPSEMSDQSIQRAASVRTVEQWVAHPYALDELLTALRVVTARYEAATPKQRLRMCDGDWSTYAVNERVSGRVPVPLPRCAS